MTWARRRSRRRRVDEVARQGEPLGDAAHAIAVDAGLDPHGVVTGRIVLPASALLACFLANLFGDDIQDRLTANDSPLLFLTLLALSIYIAIVHSLKTITAQYTSLTLVCDGSGWAII